MLDSQPSRTALATAYLRAAHQVLDAVPHVLEDSLAVSVLGKDALKRIHDTEAKYRSPSAQELRAHVVLRSRFAEDRLAEAVKRGVSQYVLLGAGLDTFAFRQPTWAKSLRIVELDHPNTQSFKLSKLSLAGITAPSNVSFGAIDFDRESLIEGLGCLGVIIDKPTFFSWLGVTMYLTEKAIDSALQSMGTFAAGSEIVLTFLEPPDQHPSARSSVRLASIVADAGEPFVSFLTQSNIENKLRLAGFFRVNFLTVDQAKTRYFSIQPSNLQPPSRTGLVCAIR